MYKYKYKYKYRTSTIHLSALSLFELEAKAPLNSVAWRIMLYGWYGGEGWNNNVFESVFHMHMRRCSGSGVYGYGDGIRFGATATWGQTLLSLLSTARTKVAVLFLHC